MILSISMSIIIITYDEIPIWCKYPGFTSSRYLQSIFWNHENLNFRISNRFLNLCFPFNNVIIYGLYKNVKTEFHYIFECAHHWSFTLTISPSYTMHFCFVLKLYTSFPKVLNFPTTLVDNFQNETEIRAFEQVWVNEKT